MCFSAPASFTASALLAALGTGLILRTKSKRLLPLAIIPWLFAMQQCAEGVVWLNLPNASGQIANNAKNTFLFFAFVFWPVWMPLSTWIAEKEEWRKQAIALCLGIGLLLAIFLSLAIPDMKALPCLGSIQYAFPFKNLGNSAYYSRVGTFFYGIATLLPLFFSSLKRIWLLGLLVTLSGVIIYAIDQFVFVSLWCFFAAIFSLMLFFVITHRE